MSVWAGGHPLLQNETMVAQVNIPLDGLLAQANGDGRSEMFIQQPVVAENLKIGLAHVKVCYKQK